MASRECTRRWYRRLLRFLPSDLRATFGEDMEQLFATRMAELEGQPSALARLWLDAITDVVIESVRDRVAYLYAAMRVAAREVIAMDAWSHDLRYGVRTLLRRPGFALAAIGTLAFGMGASVAMFSVVNGVLLRPLPYPDPDRLVTPLNINRARGTRTNSHDHPDIGLWQDRVPGFRAVGYSSGGGTLTGFGDPEVVDGASVTNGLITLFGLTPVLGRDLTGADDVPGGPRVLVISHAFWTERLGRDPTVLGRTIIIDDDPWEVVGVAPEGFEFPPGAQVWEPRRQPTDSCSHGCRVLRAIGRIEPGITIEAVQAALDVLSEDLARAIPDEHRDDVVEIERLIDTQVASVRVALWVLLGSVGAVLLIACANVANLTLLRARARAAEVSLRAMLGASRGRIVRQLLTECFLIAGAAGTVGLVLAVSGTGVLVRMAPDTLPRMDQVGLDGSALLFATLLVGVVTILCGTIPAALISAGESSHGLVGQRVAGMHGSRRVRSLLLSVEVALSLALLLAAGLLIETLRALRSVEYGFVTAGVERFRITLPNSRYDADGGVAFQKRLEERLSGLPGLTGVGMSFSAPMASGNIGASTQLLDRPPVSQADLPSLRVRPVTPGYLRASGMTLLRGRWITPADRRDAEGVAVITESAARIHFAGMDPIGRRLRVNVNWGYDDDPPRVIVGIVADARYAGAAEDPEPAAYLPNAQFAANAVYVTMRLAEGTTSAVQQARSVLRELDATLAMTSISRIEEAIARDRASTQFYMTLLTIFSVLSLTLAAVGLYTVVAYAVGQRTREIGIRIALGSGRTGVTLLVAREGAVPVLSGLALGLVFSGAAKTVIQSLLVGVDRSDVSAAAAAVVVLVAVCATATLLPALRAARLHPSVALRAE